MSSRTLTLSHLAFTVAITDMSCGPECFSAVCEILLYMWTCLNLKSESTTIKRHFLLFLRRLTASAEALCYWAVRLPHLYVCLDRCFVTLSHKRL